MAEIRIQVFIMCYNRPEYVLDSINSVLSQDFEGFEVIVSDNSTNDAVCELLEQSGVCNKVRYKRRSPNLSVFDHHNEILREADAPFFMMFHDDDIMLSDSLTILFSEIVGSQLVAVGGNAQVFKEGDAHEYLFNRFLTKRTLIKSNKQLSDHYLNSEYGIVPFPVYLYRTSAAKKISFSKKEGGIYGDVVFLLKLAGMGEIAWVPDVVMKYRKHVGSGSYKIDLIATFSLCRFVSKYSLSKPEYVRIYKSKQILIWFYQQTANLRVFSPRKNRVLLKFSIITLFSNPRMARKGLIRFFKTAT